MQQNSRRTFSFFFAFCYFVRLSVNYCNKVVTRLCFTQHRRVSPKKQCGNLHLLLSKVRHPGDLSGVVWRWKLRGG